jgi:hypothetical protein
MMKQPLMTLLLASAVFAGGHIATASDAPPEKAEAKSGTLTTEQVDALVAERPAEDGNTIRFSAKFEQVTRLTPAQKISLAGKIPYRITAEAYLFGANGRRISRLDGDLHFFILDPEGNVVVTDKRSSKQMCPT